MHGNYSDGFSHSEKFPVFVIHQIQACRNSMINYFATLFILKQKGYMDQDEWTAKRQYRSPELKLQVIEETLAPGASVARVARVHGVNANQVFAWRRRYQQGLLQPGNRATPELLAVRVSGAGADRKDTHTPRTLSGTMEVELPKGQLRLTEWDAETLRVVREALTRYAEDGGLEIDNHTAERALRAVARGRKNYLFAGSDAGGERAAALSSLIGTAKLNGLDPESYLHDVLSRIADHPINHIDELLLWNVAVQDADHPSVRK